MTGAIVMVDRREKENSLPDSQTVSPSCSQVESVARHRRLTDTGEGGGSMDGGKLSSQKQLSESPGNGVRWEGRPE